MSYVLFVYYVFKCRLNLISNDGLYILQLSICYIYKYMKKILSLFLLFTFEHFADLIRRDGFVHIFFSRIGKICNEMKTLTVAISIVYWYFIVYLYCYILNAFKMFKMFRMHLNVYKEQKNLFIRSKSFLLPDSNCWDC